MSTNLVDDLAAALHAIYRHVDVFHDEMLQVTPKELGLLLVIDDNGPTRVKDLAQRVNLPLSTVSWTADKMVGRKLLSRRADPDDRRAIRLALTRTGRAAIKAHYAVFDQIAATSVALLDPAESEAIVRAIMKIAKQFA